MYRKLTLALAAAAIATGTSWGCGGSGDDTTAQRSEASVKADAKGQDAMRAFMQSKKGGKRS